jgi:hypothetical protein
MEKFEGLIHSIEYLIEEENGNLEKKWQNWHELKDEEPK